eukprot:2323687-Amphidinium_carterae.1
MASRSSTFLKACICLPELLRFRLTTLNSVALLPFLIDSPFGNQVTSREPQVRRRTYRQTVADNCSFSTSNASHIAILLLVSRVAELAFV